MSLISYKLGQGSIVLRVKIFDSTVATGAGKTGLAYNTSGIIISTVMVLIADGAVTIYPVDDNVIVEEEAMVGKYYDRNRYFFADRVWELGNVKIKYHVQGFLTDTGWKGRYSQTVYDSNVQKGIYWCDFVGEKI